MGEGLQFRSGLAELVAESLLDGLQHLEVEEQILKIMLAGTGQLPLLGHESQRLVELLLRLPLAPPELLGLGLEPPGSVLVPGQLLGGSPVLGLQGGVL